MKQILLISLFLLSNVAAAQEVLYISKQTGESTQYYGERTITTDSTESGDASETHDDLLNVSISSMSIGENETKTFTGTVSVDVPNGPEPGSSTSAKVTGTGTGYWVDADRNHQSTTSTDVVSFTIYSIQIVLPDSLSCDCGYFNLYYTSVYPDTGTIEWDTPWGRASGASVTKAYDPSYEGKTVTAKYKTHGVSYSATSILSCQTPPLTVKVTECKNNKATVTVEADEKCGTISWAGYGTDDCSGLSCEVDVSPNLATADQEITVTYFGDCGKALEVTAKITKAQLEGFQLPACATALPDTLIYTRSIAILDFSEGCEPLVTFDPVELTIPQDQMEHTISVTATEGDRSFTSQITLVNPEITFGSDDINAIIDALGVFSEISEMIDEANELIGGVTPGFSFEVESSFPTAEELKESISINFNKNCCAANGAEEILEGVKASIGVGGSVSMGGTMPIVVPPIPPVIAYVELGLSLGVDASLSLEGEAKCPPLSVCGNITVSSEGSASGSIKILAGLASGTVSADLTLISGSGTVCVTYAPLDGSVSGQLTLGGLTLNAQVCAGISFFEYCFPPGGPASVELWSGYTIQIQSN